MLFNEPKLLKSFRVGSNPPHSRSFSALQRAEIAEIPAVARPPVVRSRFSALQRAEIAEIGEEDGEGDAVGEGFSALQRAEIAEINPRSAPGCCRLPSFSALQRAEIAEIVDHVVLASRSQAFQCSSTSRNC